MRHRRHETLRPSEVLRLSGVALLAVSAAGCAHNDVLVFGTSTTIGLNVESVSAEGAPSIVLGYEREEAVWMPLVLNGRDSNVSICAKDSQNRCTTGPVPANEAMYRSEVTDGTRTTRDTYSVFASLGARFGGNATTNGAEAEGGLAQFFATGAAAVNVTQNEALVTALKIESSGGARAQAQAVEAASLSPAQRLTLTGIRATRAAKITTIKSCVDSDAATWRSLVTAAGLAGSEVLLVSEDPDEISHAEIDDRLDGYEDAVTALAMKAKEICPTGEQP